MLPINYISIKQLLDKQLYQIDDHPIATLTTENTVAKDTIILVNELSDSDKQFLVQILTAISVTLDDVVLLNKKVTSLKKISHLKQIYQPKQIIIFGLSCMDVGLNFRWPPYHVLHFSKIHLLLSENFATIKDNKAKKKLLWAGLKKIFQ